MTLTRVPLKVKNDSASLQDFTSTEENYLAYQAGLYLITGDSESPGAIGFIGASSNNSVGSFTNTVLDSSVGTGGNNTFLTFSSSTSTLKQSLGTLLSTDSDYRNVLYMTDSDPTDDLIIDGAPYSYYRGSHSIRRAMTFDSSNNNALADRINSRIFTSDYPGSYKLSTTAPDSSEWTLKLNDVFTDTRTDGHSLQYNIYQRTSMTPPTTVRPVAIKRRSDSADILISGAFTTPGGLPSVDGFVTGSAFGDSGFGRVLLGVGDNDSSDNSYRRLTVFPPHNMLRKITPTRRAATGSGSFASNKFINAEFVLPPASPCRLRSKDSDGPDPRPRFAGIKAKVNLVDSDRFGSSAATFFATNSTAQSMVDSNGQWTLSWKNTPDTRFYIRNQGTLGFGYGGFENPTQPDPQDVYHVEGRTYWSFETGDSSNRPLPDSDTVFIIENSTLDPFTDQRDLGTNDRAIGAYDSDLIYFTLLDDFVGLQEMDDRQIQQSMGLISRNNIGSSEGTIGTYKVFSSAQGTPSDNGFSGSWASKGTATDTRNAIIDADYSRTRSSSFARLRESTFTDDFTRTSSVASVRNEIENYTQAFSRTKEVTRESSFSPGFVGNYVGNFTDDFSDTYTRTRTSTFDYLGDYLGDYVGNYSRLLSFTGNFAGTAYTRTLSGYVYVGNKHEWTNGLISIIPLQYRLQVRFGGAIVYSQTSTEPIENPATVTGGGYTYRRGSYQGGGTLNDPVSRYSVQRDGATTYVGNYTTKYTQAFTRTSTYSRTRESTVEKTRQSTFEYLGDYLGDYTGDFQQEFTRSSADAFTGDFTGDFGVAYSRNFNRNFTTDSLGDYSVDYAGNYVGDYTGDFLRTSSVSDTDPQGNIPSSGLVRQESPNVWDNRNESKKSIAQVIFNPPDGFSPGSYQIQIVSNGETVYSSGGPHANPDTGFTVAYTYGSTKTFYWGTNDSRSTTYTGSTAWELGSKLGEYTYLGNVYKYYKVILLGTFVNSYVGNFLRESLSTSTQTSTVSYTGDYTGDFILARSSNYSRFFQSDFSRDFLGGDIPTSTNNFLGNYLGDYTGDFTRNFIGNYAVDYVGNYIGNFSNHYLGDYLSEYVGNYTGSQIGSGNATIETYTLYVRYA
jgi:hypothetical protein